MANKKTIRRTVCGLCVWLSVRPSVCLSFCLSLEALSLTLGPKLNTTTTLFDQTLTVAPPTAACRYTESEGFRKEGAVASEALCLYPPAANAAQAARSLQMARARLAVGDERAAWGGLLGERLRRHSLSGLEMLSNLRVCSRFSRRRGNWNANSTCSRARVLLDASRETRGIHSAQSAARGKLTGTPTHVSPGAAPTQASALLVS